MRSCSIVLAITFGLQTWPPHFAKAITYMFSGQFIEMLYGVITAWKRLGFPTANCDHRLKLVLEDCHEILIN